MSFVVARCSMCIKRERERENGTENGCNSRLQFRVEVNSTIGILAKTTEVKLKRKILESWQEIGIHDFRKCISTWKKD